MPIMVYRSQGLGWVPPPRPYYLWTLMQTASHSKHSLYWVLPPLTTAKCLTFLVLVSFEQNFKLRK